MIYKANLKKRIFATVIDYGIYLCFFLAYVDYYGHSNNEGGLTVTGWAASPLFIFWFVYFVIVESTFGATLGHIAFGLKVKSFNKKRTGFIEALKRHLLDFIDILIYGIPAIIAINRTDKHQRLGDLWANTYIADLSDPEQNELRSHIINP